MSQDGHGPHGPDCRCQGRNPDFSYGVDEGDDSLSWVSYKGVKYEFLRHDRGLKEAIDSNFISPRYLRATVNHNLIQSLVIQNVCAERAATAVYLLKAERDEIDIEDLYNLMTESVIEGVLQAQEEGGFKTINGNILYPKGADYVDRARAA